MKSYTRTTSFGSVWISTKFKTPLYPVDYPCEVIDQFEIQVLFKPIGVEWHEARWSHWRVHVSPYKYEKEEIGFFSWIREQEGKNLVFLDAWKAAIHWICDQQKNRKK